LDCGSALPLFHRMAWRRESGRGLPQSKTLSRHTEAPRNYCLEVFGSCNVQNKSMKRREFLKTSLIASAATAVATSTLAQTPEEKPMASREFYELRQYHLRQGPMLRRFDEFYRDIAVPAW